MSPFVQDRLGEITSWEKVKLLTVLVDRLLQWYRPGLICIGDAAHAMSPIGGVGIWSNDRRELQRLGTNWKRQSELLN
jgi:2-polyprenyl-6-methoxyphenol hydroxylase-like FAD-dependent oxidoreductase